MKIRDCHQEIENLTSLLIEEGIAESFNPPIIVKDGGVTDVVFQNGKDISVALKSLPYADIHAEMIGRKMFNFRFADDAFVQMSYRFEAGGGLLKHRLAYYPSPTFEPYQNEPEIYEEDLIFADVVDKGVLPIPVRFDYDPGSFVEVQHPSSHLTFGMYKNCRIPVVSPLRPTYFMHFILSSFYRKRFDEMDRSLKFSDVDKPPHSATAKEKVVLHIAF